jgi:hypothetical protein
VSSVAGGREGVVAGAGVTRRYEPQSGPSPGHDQLDAAVVRAGLCGRDSESYGQHWDDSYDNISGLLDSQVLDFDPAGALDAAGALMRFSQDRAGQLEPASG